MEGAALKLSGWLVFFGLLCFLFGSVGDIVCQGFKVKGDEMRIGFWSGSLLVYGCSKMVISKEGEKGEEIEGFCLSCFLCYLFLFPIAGQTGCCGVLLCKVVGWWCCRCRWLVECRLGMGLFAEG